VLIKSASVMGPVSDEFMGGVDVTLEGDLLFAAVIKG
jgi:hypothetical protein